METDQSPVITLSGNSQHVVGPDRQNSFVHAHHKLAEDTLEQEIKQALDYYPTAIDHLFGECDRPASTPTSFGDDCRALPESASHVAVLSLFSRSFWIISRRRGSDSVLFCSDQRTQKDLLHLFACVLVSRMRLWLLACIAKFLVYLGLAVWLAQLFLLFPE